MVPVYAAMIPTLVPKPFHRDGWVYEEKVDGYRMLAYKEGPHVRLVSRHGIDHVHRYPLVMAAVASLPAKTLVVDAELAVSTNSSAQGSTGCATASQRRLRRRRC